jgi:3-phenylpropionate/cinnamic acid dioxygenase small subunit
MLLHARSCFLVYFSRGNNAEATLFSGERHDVLRSVDGPWRLAERTITLVAYEAPAQPVDNRL